MLRDVGGQEKLYIGENSTQHAKRNQHTTGEKDDAEIGMYLSRQLCPKLIEESEQACSKGKGWILFVDEFVQNELEWKCQQDIGPNLRDGHHNGNNDHEAIALEIAP